MEGDLIIMKNYTIKIDKYDMEIVFEALNLLIAAADIFAEDARDDGYAAKTIIRDLKNQIKEEKP